MIEQPRFEAADMIPDFDDEGNLPPGIHRATIEEVEQRFGHGSPEREVEIRELADFVAWARRAGVRRLMVNGSFTTAKESPNDVDVVILPSEATLSDPQFGTSSEAAWPFLQILVAVDDADFEQWAHRDFATDREGRNKGVVEVIL
jgi:hypothetical protein